MLGVLVLLCAAQFMVILDTTIVTVALPSIQADLGFASQASLQYVISLYSLTFAGSLILAGRLADLRGRKRVFTVGLVAFTVASLACGLAPVPWVLLLARTIQGTASAMISAAALALLTTLFTEGRARSRALGAWGAVGGAAGAAGLVLGGGFTALLGWEWVFLINVPVGLAAAIASGRLLPADRERNTDAPLVDLRLFLLPGVTGANIVALLLTTVISSNLFFTTLYAQRVLHLSPLLTGLAFLPNSALVVVGSSLASKLVGRLGPRWTLAMGLAVVGLGSLMLSAVSPDGGYVTDVLPGFALTGLGLGITFVSATIAATRGVDADDQGLASGVFNTAQQLGFAVGIATVVTAANGQYSTGYLLDTAIAVVALAVGVATISRRS